MLKRLHRWLGIAVAAWLLVASITGLCLLVEDEYYGWRYPALPDPAAAFGPRPDVIDTILADASRPVTVLGMPTRTLAAYHAYFDDGSEALYHPETGAKVVDWTALDALPGFLFELHAHMLAGDIGHTFVGVVGLVGAANILAGIVLWWRRRDVFRIRHAVPRTAEKKYLLRGHAAQGALLGVLVAFNLLAGSAVVFAGPALTGLSSLLGVSGNTRPTVQRIESQGSRVDWAAATAAAQTRFPDADIRFLMPPQAPGMPLVIRLRNDGELHPNGRSYAVVHPGTGELLESIDATQTGLGPAVFDALYPLHAGKTGWPGYRLLLALIALSLIYIAASGAYLYLSRPKAPATTRALA